MGTPITGHHRLLYPSKYLAAPDLRNRDVNVIIDRLEWETLKMQGGKSDTKVCVFMRHPKTGQPLGKSWPVGKTVLAQLAQATGETDVSKWSGKIVTLFPTTCRGPAGNMVECVRVRVRVHKTAEEPNETIMAPPSTTPLVFDEDDDTDADAIGLRDTSAPVPAVVTGNGPPCTRCGSTNGLHRYEDGMCAPCYDRADAEKRGAKAEAVAVTAPLPTAPATVDDAAAAPEPANVTPVDVETRALAALVAALETAGGSLTVANASKTIREGLGMAKLHVTRRAALLAVGVTRGLFTVTGDGDAAVIQRVVAVAAPVTVPPTEKNPDDVEW